MGRGQAGPSPSSAKWAWYLLDFAGFASPSGHVRAPGELGNPVCSFFRSGCEGLLTSRRPPDTCSQGRRLRQGAQV